MLFLASNIPDIFWKVALSIITIGARLLEIETCQSMRAQRRPPFEKKPHKRRFKKRFRNAARNASVTLLQLYYHQKHRKKLKIIV